MLTLQIATFLAYILLISADNCYDCYQDFQTLICVCELSGCEVYSGRPIEIRYDKGLGIEMKFTSTTPYQPWDAWALYLPKGGCKICQPDRTQKRELPDGSLACFYDDESPSSPSPPAPSPSSVPSPTPPSMGITELCNPRNADMCITASKSTYTVGVDSNIVIDFKSTPKKWRLVVMPKELTAINSNNAIFFERFKRNNGSKSIPVRGTMVNKEYKVYITTRSFGRIAGPLLLKVQTQTDENVPLDPLDEFQFYPYFDSHGGDLKLAIGDVDDFAEECYRNPNCKGFNSNGWLKDTVKNQSEWSQWTDDSSLGFYLRKHLDPLDPLDEFQFYPYFDSHGGDLKLAIGDVDDFAEECYRNPNCKGFNSNGWLKVTVKNQSEWSQWTDDSSLGFYLRK